MPEIRIVAKLLATTAVTALIGDRLRKHHRKSTWGGADAITYQRISTAWVNHAGGVTETAFARIQLDLWSATPAGLKALADAVRGALSGWSDKQHTPKIALCHLIIEMELPGGPDAGEEESGTEYCLIQEYLIDYYT